jgi:hypothetical protein
LGTKHDNKWQPKLENAAQKTSASSREIREENDQHPMVGN